MQIRFQRCDNGLVRYNRDKLISYAAHYLLVLAPRLYELILL